MNIFQSNQRPLATVILVSFNTRNLTVKAIDTLKAQTTSPIKVVVYDNASVDGSAAVIKTAFPHITVIESENNIGFAGANNEAAKVAEGKYLLLLNPDTEVLDGAVDKLLSFATEFPEARIWGGRTVYGDYTENPSSCWRRQSLRGLILQATGLNSIFRKSPLFNAERVFVSEDTHAEHVDIVSGCFMLIERELFESLGGFKADYFMYGEDSDLCLRAREKGAIPMVTGRARIIHHGGASETVHADKLVRLLKAKHLLVQDHMRGFRRSLGRLLLASWPWTRMVSHHVLASLGYVTSRAKRDTWLEVWRRRPEWLPNTRSTV